MPIRGSDKCGVESTCLNFANHVKALYAYTPRDSLRTNAYSIISTTESEQVAAERAMYAARHREVKFVVNHDDVLPNTGYMAVGRAHRTDTDSMLLSSVSSLSLQLQHADTILGNCCSNFHLLLGDLMQACQGGNINNHRSNPSKESFICLQDHEQHEFRITCSWDGKSQRAAG